MYTCILFLLGSPYLFGNEKKCYSNKKCSKLTFHLNDGCSLHYTALIGGSAHVHPSVTHLCISYPQYIVVYTHPGTLGLTCLSMVVEKKVIIVTEMVDYVGSVVLKARTAGG